MVTSDYIPAKNEPGPDELLTALWEPSSGRYARGLSSFN